ncbi:MAG: 2OG-Fe(II) oxygenase [Paracoccaceae bacterium]|nr:2OG-Fe(II) oxygenase [Paracoccaceae bacterium]
MHDLIDLDRYPLDRLDSAEGRALVAICQADLGANGMFNLDGLVRPDALAQAVADVAPVLNSAAFTHRRAHNIYFEPEIPGLAPDHPALRLCETVNHTICADQIPDAVVLRLYEWPPFAAFLAAVMQKPALHTMADPLARVNVMEYRAGEALNWHFDRSEFTTTLLLQAPEGGGDFEYRSDLRSDDDPNYAGVARLLERRDDRVEQLHLLPGTLNVFRGKNTAHRVTPVEGDRSRIIAVFSFYDRPGVMFSDAERIGFYGRAA